MTVVFPDPSMSSIGPVSAATTPTSGHPSRARAAAGGELAKLEHQLSEWVNCPSSNTSAGKAKISEISGKIGVIKAQAERVETDKHSAASNVRGNQSATKRAQEFLRDGVGGLLNVQA